MRLLIITQKVDINDDVLGFMHGWIKEFAKNCEKVTVVCLQKDEYDLPENVKVLSLGKEGGASRLKYVLNFYKYIWQERKNYDKVFVHMNKEYVVLGGLFWRLSRKNIALWYNHTKGNIISRIAGRLANRIFYTSPFSFFSKWKKATMMPAGIDTDKFNIDESIERKKKNILSLGRIDRVKNVHVLVDALKLINENFVVNIYGSGQGGYCAKIKEDSKIVNERGNNKIIFHGNVPNYKTPEIYNQNEIFINLTNSGSLDKTTLEAMACKSLVLVSNESYRDIFPAKWHDLLIFKEKDEKDLAQKLKKLINLPEEERQEIKNFSREAVIEGHSLKKLISKIFN